MISLVDSKISTFIALTDMRASCNDNNVTKGAMTTMPGVFMLTFSQSEVFRVFFYMFCKVRYLRMENVTMK